VGEGLGVRGGAGALIPKVRSKTRRTIARTSASDGIPIGDH